MDTDKTEPIHFESARIRISLDNARDGRGWHCPGVLSPPTMALSCDSATLETALFVHGTVKQTWSDPLAALAWMSDSLRYPVSANSSGRWVGYLSYDLGRLFEPMLARAVDDLRVALFVFTYHERVGTAAVPVSSAGALASAEIPHSNFTQQAYWSVVARAKEYIAAGDVFQVNLSQRFTTKLTAEPHMIYQRLRQFYPSDYGACLIYDDFALLCNSPELFLRVSPDRQVITRPIKGTRPLKPGMQGELRDSTKDQAELNMIVDLERNDLGRVCEIGSVKVIEPRTIESHPTVYHGVATIGGKLRDEIDFVELLRATFPGGSITGAPKIRAMQIIDELEAVRRGPYCGAIGYLAADGSMEFNVAIRTMIVKDGMVHIPVGGGIVADSDPVEEYEETLVKAKAMFEALGIGESAKCKMQSAK